MDSRAHEQSISRLRVLARIFFCWALVIFARLVYLQVLSHEELSRAAQQQQERLVEVQAPRGTIFDRAGRPLAMSIPVDSVCINPARLPDRAVAAEILAGALKMNRAELLRDIEQAYTRGRGFLWVKRGLSAEESSRLHSYSLDWIEFRKETRRVYPKGPIGAHVVGSVNHEETGNSGLELTFDDELQGHPGTMRVLSDVRMRVFDSRVKLEPEPGRNLTLTIDERIQYIAEQELKKAVEAAHAATGTVVVENPHTGELLAMASYPSFDPNDRPKPGESLSSRLNLAAAAPFEPGSVFKIITISAALETTKLRPETLIHCGNGTLTLFGRVIHEAKHGYGTIPMEDVLARSSNIGAIQVGLQVGASNLLAYVKKFGFGKPTGLPLPAESGGMVRELRKWGASSIGSVAMGHEISTTAVQLAQACSVIANGGVLIKPRVLLSTQRPGGPPEPVPAAAPVRVLRGENAIEMRKMMEGVVVKPYGTGHLRARLKGYSSGGKTGSAQIFDFKTGQYTHKYNASFVGFAPVANPALVIAVTINGTTTSAGFGGVVAAPVFREVAMAALRLLDVPKDIPEDDSVATPEPEQMNDVAIASLSQPPAPEELQPPVGSPLPKAPEHQVALGPKVPNFAGKTVRAVIEESSAMGLKVEFTGNGIARAQAPPPGSVLSPGERVRVEFAR